MTQTQQKQPDGWLLGLKKTTIAGIGGVVAVAALVIRYVVNTTSRFKVIRTVFGRRINYTCHKTDRIQEIDTPIVGCFMLVRSKDKSATYDLKFDEASVREDFDITGLQRNITFRPLGTAFDDNPLRYELIRGISVSTIGRTICSSIHWGLARIDVNDIDYEFGCVRQPTSMDINHVLITNRYSMESNHLLRRITSGDIHWSLDYSEDGNGPQKWKLPVRAKRVGGPRRGQWIMYAQDATILELGGNIGMSGEHFYQLLTGKAPQIHARIVDSLTTFNSIQNNFRPKNVRELIISGNIDSAAVWNVAEGLLTFYYNIFVQNTEDKFPEGEAWCGDMQDCIEYLAERAYLTKKDSYFGSMIIGLMEHLSYCTLSALDGISSKIPIIQSVSSSKEFNIVTMSNEIEKYKAIYEMGDLLDAKEFEKATEIYTEIISQYYHY